MWSSSWKVAELAMRREHSDPPKGAADLPDSEAEAASGPSCVCAGAMLSLPFTHRLLSSSLSFLSFFVDFETAWFYT